jgi:hypothetical protein
MRRSYEAQRLTEAIECLAGPVGKHKIVGCAEILVAYPHPLDRRKNHTMFVERHLALTGFGLHVIELIVVDTFVHNDAIA